MSALDNESGTDHATEGNMNETGVNAANGGEPRAAHNDNRNASTDASLNARVKTSRKKPRFRWWILVAVVVVVALIVGLIVWNRPSKESATRADSLTIGLKLAPTNLDIRNQSGTALDQALIGNVYEGLVAKDAKNNVIPGLAESWDTSADGKTYTFHLYNNTTFSNGDKLTANDVAWSINELISKQYQGSQTLRNVESVSATDEKTVRIELSAPYSDLLWTLTGRPGLVFDKHAQYDLKTTAVGSGPYLLSSFTPNQSIRLQANTKYWGIHKPKTATVILRYIADDNAAVNALKSGDVQVLAPILGSLAAPIAKQTDKYVVKAGDDTDKYVLAFNMKGDLGQQKEVRQAIRYAINHTEIIASRGGADMALGGPIPSLDPGYENLTNLYPYNLNKAQELMKQAGYSESKPLTLRLTYANTYGTPIGDQLRSQLKAIGIDLKVQVVEFSTWLQDVYTNRDFDISLVDHNESHDFYQWADPTYYYGYDNKQVQQLYEQSVNALSNEERDKYLQQAARLVSEDAPADWLLNYRVTTAYALGVEDFPLNMNQSLLPLYNVTYTPKTK